MTKITLSNLIYSVLRLNTNSIFTTKLERKLSPLNVYLLNIPRIFNNLIMYLSQKLYCLSPILLRHEFIIVTQTKFKFEIWGLYSFHESTLKFLVNYCLFNRSYLYSTTKRIFRQFTIFIEFTNCWVMWKYTNSEFQVLAIKPLFIVKHVFDKL